MIEPAAPTTIYAAAMNGGVLKSIDGGMNWNAVNTGLTSLNVVALAIDPTTSAIYAGTIGYGGIFKTTNGAGTWSAAGLTGLWVNSIAIAIDSGSSATVYAGTSGGLYKSTDGGANWSQVNIGPTSLNVRALAIDPTNSATIYAGTSGGLYKSIDGGANWSQVNTGTGNYPVFTLAIDPTNSATIYVSAGWVVKSTDGGAHWDYLNTSTLGYIGAVRAFAISPTTSTTVYAATDGGPLKSTDGGVSWSRIETGFTSLMVNALSIDSTAPGTVYAGTSNTPAKNLFKSMDGGASWSVITSLADQYGELLPISAMAIDPTGIVYAGTTNFVGYRGVFKSSDGGTSWTALRTGMPDLHVTGLAIAPTDSATIYAGTWGGGVFTSTDAGANWSAVNNGLTDSIINALAVDPTCSATVYEGPLSGGLFKSIDGGANWSALSMDSSYLDAYALVIDPTNPATVYAGGDAPGGSFISKSTTGGATWTKLDIGPTQSSDNVHVLAIDPTTSSTVYAGTNRGVLKSTDGGTHWCAINTDLTTLVVSSLVTSADGHVLYAGTQGGGVFSYEATTYTVTPSTVMNGSISPPTPQTVNYNCSTSFRITPHTGYRIDSVTGCGGTLSGNTYTTGLITADCSVTASFAANDSTPPITTASVSPSPNGTGWNKSNVTVTLASADNPGGSGVNSITYQMSGAQAVTVPGSAASFTISAEDITTVSYYAQDNAGNVEAVETLVVNIDKTPPAVSFGATCPASAVLNSIAQVTVTVSDALSGVASQSAPNGVNALNTSTVGANNFTVTAQDNAGNSGSSTCLYRIAYDYQGSNFFASPIAAPPTVNAAKAGRTVPVKFSLIDANGVYISNINAVTGITYVAVPCSTFAINPGTPITKATSTGNSTLRYDSTANQFIYNWKTPDSPGCYVLQVQLNDGSTYQSYFNLK